MEHGALLDTRLMDLAPRPGGDYRYVRALALTQALTYNLTGHMLAYNDEYVWRKLKANPAGEELPDVRVRCIHCWRMASLRDWARAAALSTKERASRAEQLLKDHKQAAVGFLLHCDGAVQARAILSMFEDQAGGDA